MTIAAISARITKAAMDKPTARPIIVVDDITADGAPTVTSSVYAVEAVDVSEMVSVDLPTATDRTLAIEMLCFKVRPKN